MNLVGIKVISYLLSSFPLPADKSSDDFTLMK